MTERGHGSNVRGIITEARYDQSTQVIPKSILLVHLQTIWVKRDFNAHLENT